MISLFFSENWSEKSIFKNNKKLTHPIVPLRRSNLTHVPGTWILRGDIMVFKVLYLLYRYRPLNIGKLVFYGIPLNRYCVYVPLKTLGLKYYKKFVTLFSDRESR